MVNINYCEDITEKYISEIDYNKVGVVKNAKYVIVDNKKYFVNKVNRVIHEENEVLVAEWIRDFLHKDVEYLPNISEDDGIKCGDYLINHDEMWELKTIAGNSSRTLDSSIKNKRN